MSLIQIDRNPPRRQLNLFGLIWLVFFSVAGGVVLRNDAPVVAAVCLWVLAIVVPLLGWVFPQFMRIVYVGMAYMTLPIGLVVSFVIMAVVYYLLVTPIGLAMRLFGYDPMNRRFEPTSKTYWHKRESEAEQNVERYFRQF